MPVWPHLPKQNNFTCMNVSPVPVARLDDISSETNCARTESYANTGRLFCITNITRSRLSLHSDKKIQQAPSEIASRGVLWCRVVVHGQLWQITATQKRLS